MRLSSWEQDFKKKGKIFCGTDEVGRGSIAGPVVAATYIPDLDFPLVRGVKDSKKLSSLNREILFSKLIKRGSFGVGIVEHTIIDKINIHKASLLAMKTSIINSGFIEVAFIDGKYLPELNLEMIDIVHGDSLLYSIAAASIIAKVIRDALMCSYSHIFSGYFFEKHKGYPTRIHKKMLAELGPCSIHRQSYTPVKELGYDKKYK